MNKIIKLCFCIIMLNIFSVKMIDINGDKIVPQLLISDDFGNDNKSLKFAALKNDVMGCIDKDFKGCISIFHYLQNGFKINRKDFKIDSNLATVIFNFSYLKYAVDICEVRILGCLHYDLYEKSKNYGVEYLIYDNERKELRLNKLYDDLASIKSLKIDGNTNYCKDVYQLYSLIQNRNILYCASPSVFINITSSKEYYDMYLSSDIININSKEKHNINIKDAYIANIKGTYDSIIIGAKYIILDNVTCNSFKNLSSTQCVIRNSHAKECSDDYNAYIDNSSKFEKGHHGNYEIISDEKINKYINQLSNINFEELKNSINDYDKNSKDSYKEFKDNCKACFLEIKSEINIKLLNLRGEQQKTLKAEYNHCLNYTSQWFGYAYRHKDINEEMILEDFGSITIKNIVG